MCGIVGFYGGSAFSNGSAGDVLNAMTRSLKHRGPDGEGAWIDAEASIALGHRRLSVIDLTGAGRQPMVSSYGRFIVTYNGEIYNYRTLRRALETKGIAFRGDSDTEVMLSWIETHGLDSFLREAEGMFAFGLWDRAERSLTLARDHAGIKPLFYATGLTKGAVAFASELKALAVWPDFDAALDRTALAQYLRYGYVPAPRTIHLTARKVEPGCIVIFTADGAARQRRYWNIAQSRAEAVTRYAGMTDAEITDHVEAEIIATVTQEMVSDVPVGSLLSGGIDSSLITAIMMTQSREPVRTYSAGFADTSIDESRHAEAVASHLGCRHTTVMVDPATIQPVLRRLAEIYDEPLSDMASLPTYIVCARAREDVTVVLSGDGGDEGFGGYDRYQRGLDLMSHARRVPAAARAAVKLLTRGPLGSLAAIGVSAIGKAPGRDAARRRLARFTDSIANDNRMDVYMGLTSLWSNAEEIVGAPVDRAASLAAADAAARDDLDYFQLADVAVYLPDALLTKTDRASMAHGLEARVPFVGRRVLCAGLALPTHLRRGRASKALLRDICYRQVDRRLVDRPKQGFGVPMAAWLRGPLRSWAEERLDRSALLRTGLFDPAPIRRRWDEHRTGSVDWSYALWAVLVAQDWAEAQGLHAKNA